jgi:hypothetical protein
MIETPGSGDAKPFVEGYRVVRCRQCRRKLLVRAGRKGFLEHGDLGGLEAG